MTNRRIQVKITKNQLRFNLGVTFPSFYLWHLGNFQKKIKIYTNVAIINLGFTLNCQLKWLLNEYSPDAQVNNIILGLVSWIQFFFEFCSCGKAHWSSYKTYDLYEINTRNYKKNFSCFSCDSQIWITLTRNNFCTCVCVRAFFFR